MKKQLSFDEVFELMNLNVMLLNISEDNSFNEEIRELARATMSNSFSINAKKAIIEICQETASNER